MRNEFSKAVQVDYPTDESALRRARAEPRVRENSKRRARVGRRGRQGLGFLQSIAWHGSPRPRQTFEHMPWCVRQCAASEKLLPATGARAQMASSELGVAAQELFASRVRGLLNSSTQLRSSGAERQFAFGLA